MADERHVSAARVLSGQALCVNGRGGLRTGVEGTSTVPALASEVTCSAIRQNPAVSGVPVNESSTPPVELARMTMPYGFRLRPTC